MAYEISSASGMHDLLDKLRDFLVANGYVEESYVADSQMYESWSGLTSTGSYRLHVSKILGQSGDQQECFFNFRSGTRIIPFEDHYTLQTQSNGRYYSEMRGIALNASTGYSGAGNWDQEPGAPEAGATGKNIGACITEVPTGSFNYWFFLNGDTCVVVAELAANTYGFMAFGRLMRKGGYDGGMFYWASQTSYEPSYQYWYYSSPVYDYSEYRAAFMGSGESGAGGVGGVYLTADGVTDWRHVGQEGSQTGGYTKYIHGAAPCAYQDLTAMSIPLGVWFISRAPNTVNAVCPMMPCYVMCKFASGRWGCLGYPEGIRLINRTQYSPGDSFILGDTGGEEWVVFPAHQIGPDPDHPDCDNLDNRIGFAFLKSA